ncbi:electron transfer flavoprotein subunit alpha/FixB family protein [Actinoplanes sp. NPDC049802]|uniref:electron transfer flavoprotein subunit alpha/FixB family protein n=1 Tax=Actinoplanes sp. NPDC049802 TaxID=3154742 RepID=UPI0033DD530D
MPTYLIVPPTGGVDRLLGIAAPLDGPVVALVVGDTARAESVAHSGVDEVRWIEAAPQVPAEAYAAAVAGIVTSAPGVLLAGRDPASRVLLGAAAGAIGAPVLVGVDEVSTEAGTVVVQHGVYGGIAQRTTVFDGPVALMIDAGGVTAQAGAAPITAVEATPQSITLVSARSTGGGAVDLPAARRVLGVGRGVKAQADLALAQDLATALDAELGCTRPLAEGLEWLPKNRYIGISGAHIQPDLYLAVGVSGQLQHMAGVRASGTIVAINSDPSAPVMDDADYQVVGDLYKVLPALVAELAGNA